MQGKTMKTNKEVTRKVSFTEIEGGSVATVAGYVADLRLDDLTLFLEELTNDLRARAQFDRERGRERVATALGECCFSLSEAGYSAKTAWRYTKPYMENEDV